MRWIIGIVAVVVIAVLGYQYFGGARDVEEVAQRAQEGAQQAGQAVEQAAKDAGQAVQETAEKAADAVKGAAQEATQTAKQAADEATAGAKRAADATRETAEEAVTATEQTAREAAGAVEGTAERAGEEAAEAVGAGTEQATETAEAMQQSLSEAQTAALTVGDVNLGEQLGAVVQNVDTTLDGITDAASAEAALPALNDLNTKLEGLKTTVGQLPDDAKKILADFLDPRLEDLKATAENVMNRTGVGEVLRPAVDPILATLDSWARQPA